MPDLKRPVLKTRLLGTSALCEKQGKTELSDAIMNPAKYSYDTKVVELKATVYCNFGIAKGADRASEHSSKQVP